MDKELALFIQDLEFGLQSTNRAEDRQLYERYLASASCILAKVVLGSPQKELFSAIDSNERLWGNTWLIDPVVGNNPDSYEKFKTIAGYPGYGNT